MSVEKFIEKIEDEFEELEPGTLTPESNFREYFEWNSVNALIIIALVDSEYDVTINAEDIQKSETVNDLYTRVLELKEAS
ncbi:MAG: acyl carrier protein [Bacteroidales bacterium]|nr:acyl carrier protein [Bacteroidales bacterium]MCF8338029.1 acyl carrier protein [Bacteroidales bacterium]